MLDDMLGSFYANARCPDAMVVVFGLHVNDACERVIAKYRATLVRCEPRSRVNPMSKAVLYSAARVVDADRFLFLDADMLVLRSTARVRSARRVSRGSILACREGNNASLQNLGHALYAVYGGSDGDLSSWA